MTTMPPSSHGAIGQTLSSGALKFKVYSFKAYGRVDNQGPKRGDHIVAVDVAVVNPTRQDIGFSSLLWFRLLDSKNRLYYESPAAGLSRETEPAGDRSKGSKRK